MDDKPWGNAVQRAFSRNDPYFMLAAYYENDPIIRQVKDAYKKNFRMLSATAQLHFYSLVKGKMISESVPVIGMVLVEDSCQANVIGSGGILMPDGSK